MNGTRRTRKRERESLRVREEVQLEGIFSTNLCGQRYPSPPKVPNLRELKVMVRARAADRLGCPTLANPDPNYRIVRAVVRSIPVSAI